MKKNNSLFLVLILCLFSFSFSQNRDDIVGTWISSKGTGHIEIYKKGDKYFGKLAWMKEPKNEDGTAKKDINNPKENLRSRTLQNLVLLRDFEYLGGNTWEEGKIYDPESGNDYSCKLTMVNKNKLEVRGFIGISLFGRTEVWTRKS